MPRKENAELVCHPYHMSMGSKRMKVIVTFEEGDHFWQIYHLARKYTGGCVPDFIRQMMGQYIKNEFAIEINEDIALMKQAKEAKTKGEANVQTIPTEVEKGTAGTTVHP